MAALRHTIDGCLCAAGNMFQIAWSGFPMKGNPYRFFCLEDYLLPNLKILGRNQAEVPDHQIENTEKDSLKNLHVSVITKLGREYQAIIGS